MSADPSGTNQPWDQPYTGATSMEPPRKKGLSCGCIALIVVCILFVLLGLLCCGGVVGIGYYFGQAVSEEPGEIAKVTGEIAQIDIPEGLAPKFSMNLKVPFSGERMMSLVAYVDESTASTLTLGFFGGPMAGQGEGELRRSMESAMREQGVEKQENVAQRETSEKEIEVRGEKVKFHFATGVDNSGKKRIQVTGVIPGGEGPTILSFSGDAEKYNEETLVKMIESIK